MTGSHPLSRLVEEHKSGRAIGIYSVCSANRFVLQAAARRAQRDGTHLLAEATSNQVDQFGGYTGMTPCDFVARLHEIAAEEGLPRSRIILGGDHLGPNAWRRERSHAAMRKANTLVEAYVKAGFSKIHLDCSMSCSDDPVPLPDEIVAERAAELMASAETALGEMRRREARACDLVYVIGTEVPAPGGARGGLGGHLQVTSPADAEQTLGVHQAVLAAHGLGHVWDRVAGLVVQPGVEFDNQSVADYAPAAARDLSRLIESYPTMLYEAHSTDYQSADSLRSLVQGHFAILKVGPALTFALREALFGLEMIEREIRGPAARSGLIAALDSAMRREPRYWQEYYSGSESELAYLRKYSFSDRSRYYMADVEVADAVERLFASLSEAPIPLTALSQFMPDAFKAVRRGDLVPDPREIALFKIDRVLRDYAAACAP